MSADRVLKKRTNDKVLTVQVHHQNLDPRTFLLPVKWIYRSSVLAWLLIVISLTATFFAYKTYRMKGGNHAAIIAELENEIRDLKSSGTASAPQQTVGKTVESDDQNARDTKPESEPGQPMTAQEGIWSGLAPRISLPSRDFVAPIELTDVKINWQGKYAMVSGIVAFKEQGKGSQQGHIIILARGKDRIIAHPDNVLNVSNSSFLFNAENGEYFSVARFRILKAKLGPFDNNSQLEQVQVYLFDNDNKLILTQSFQHGKK